METPIFLWVRCFQDPKTLMHTATPHIVLNGKALLYFLHVMFELICAKETESIINFTYFNAVKLIISIQILYMTFLHTFSF